MDRNVETVNPKVIIFDCDGVMFDSKAANEAYYNAILTHFRKDKMNREQCEYVHMNTVGQSVAFLFRDDPREEQAQAYREKMSYFPFISMMEMEPYLKGFIEFLRPSRKTAIASNRSDTMNHVLEEHGLTGLFDLVVSSLDVKHAKPAPDCLLKIVDHFGILPNEALYVGDSSIDERAAKAAGIPLVAYKNRHLSAVYHVDSFREMKALLGNR